MSRRLDFLREQHGRALLDAFLDDDRNTGLASTITGSENDRIDAVFSLYRQADPTPTASCTQWLIRLALVGRLPAEDLTKARETLEAFQAYGRLMNADARDLGRHADLGSLWEAVSPFVAANAATSGKDQDRREKAAARAESDVLLEENGWTVVIPRTVRASQWWGRGTRWCTAAVNNNMFERYSRSAPLVIFVSPDGDKFQFHASNNDFMNSSDRSVDYREKIAPILPLLQERIPALDLAMRAPSLSGRAFSGLRNRIEAMTGVSFDHDIPAWEAAVADFGLPLGKVPFGARTKAACRNALGWRGMDLGEVPRNILDKEMIDDAIADEPKAAFSIDKTLWTPAVCLALVRENGLFLADVPKDLKTREVCLEAVRDTGDALAFVPTTLIDRDLCMEAVRERGTILQNVPASMRDYQICMTAVISDGRALPYVPEDLRDRSLCLEAVKGNGEMLAHVPQNLLDRDFCKRALMRGRRTLNWVPMDLRDRELCAIALTASPGALEFVPRPLIDADLCRRLVREDPRCLRHVPHDLVDLDMCKTAVDRLPKTLAWVPDRLNSKELCLTAILGDTDAFDHVPQRFRDQDFMSKVVAINGGFLREVPKEERTFDLCLSAVRSNDSAMFHVPKHLQKMIVAAFKEEEARKMQMISDAGAEIDGLLQQNSEHVRTMPDRMDRLIQDIRRVHEATRAMAAEEAHQREDGFQPPPSSP